jgi:hypothetical protein
MGGMRIDTDGTYILVGNDFDILDVASGLEDLSQHLFGDPRVQASNI